MMLLLDTHLILWAAYEPSRLSKPAREMITEPSNELLFSAASIWEVAIKSGLSRADFNVDANVLRRGLLEHGYTELPISATHAAAVSALPSLHRDPFDRLLVAQARVEGVPLLTADSKVADYGNPARLI